MNNGLLCHATLAVSLAFLAPASACYAGTNDFGLLRGGKTATQLSSFDFDYYEGYEAEENEPVPSDEVKEPASCQCGIPQCGGCRKRRLWIAGVEATFLAPQLDGDPVAIAVADIVAGTTNVLSSTAAGLENLYVAPRTWLGIQGERWGLVGRYWHLSDSENQFDPLVLPLNDTQGFLAASRIEAYTVDLEVTRKSCCRSWDTELAFGVRHAELENDVFLAASQVDVSGNLLTGSAYSDRQFNGTGLTLGLAGRRPVSARFPNMLMFWSMRGSLMWGNVKTAVETSATFANPGFSNAFVTGAQADTSDDMFIGEVQLGLEREYALKCLPASAFIRTAVEYQYWDATGGVAASTAGAGLLNQSIGAAAAYSDGLRMDLIGLAIGAGLNW